MSFFHGPDFSELDSELAAIIEAKELKDKTANDFAESNGEKRQFLRAASELMSGVFLRPFSCIGVIYIIYELSGFEVVTAYAQTFFEKTGVQLDPSLAAIVSGSFRLLSSLLAPIVLLKAPKKPLFLICGTLSAVGMASGDNHSLSSEAGRRID